MSSIATSQLYETNDQSQWHLSILVLAAGRSSRLGCNKQLVSIDNKPLLTRCFDNIKGLRKKLEEAMKVTDDFGRDARSIGRTLENIKDPEQVEKAIKEDVDKIKVLNK